MLFQKRNKYIVSLSAILFILIAATSCETKEPECYEPIVVLVNNAFFQKDTTIVTHYLPPDSIAVDSVEYTFPDSTMGSPEMKALNETVDIRITGVSVSTLGIPLNPAKDSIQYSFRTDTASAFSDTITFYYTPIVQFISNSCGYTHYFTLNNVKTTHNLLDSVALINANVNQEASVRNVHFYFKKNF